MSTDSFTNDSLPWSDAGDFGIFCPRKNLACMAFHRRSFGVPSSVTLSAFEGLVRRSKHCTVEVSCKVFDQSVSAARFNLFFHDERKSEHLQDIFRFFREVERETPAKFNFRLFHEFYGDDFDLNRVRKVVTGMDLHKDFLTSRFKIWFIFHDLPAKVQWAILLHGNNEELRDLILHKEFLVGFDFCPDGRSDIKLYPDVRQEELRRRSVRVRLAGILTPAALELMDCSWWTHIYISRHNRGRVLQCHPSDPDYFVKRFLPTEPAWTIHHPYQGKKLLDMVVSVSENELLNPTIRNFNLYYMPAESPSLDLCGNPG